MTTRIEQLQQMLLQEPNDAFLQYALGIEYFSIGNFTKSFEYFNTLLQQSPDYLAAYYQTGKCLEELKQVEEAKGIYTKGIELAKKQNKLKTLNELNEALFLLEEG